MTNPNIKLGARMGGLVLKMVSDLVGARVTSWKRSDKVNAGMRGAAKDSSHLVGGAVDLGRELSPYQRGVVSFFAESGGYTQVGTAPHFHHEASWRTFAKGALLVLPFGIWVYMLRNRRRGF